MWSGENAAVPHAVEVRLVFEKPDIYPVPAEIAATAKMHGLVDVADKMDHNLERERLR